MTPELAKALPFFAAALAQIMAALVRSLSGHFTVSHFENVEGKEAVPSFEVDIDPQLRPKRLARDIIPDDYKADAIARVNSKNAEGANALTGSITILAAVLGSGLIADGAFYGVAVLLSAGIGLAFAIALWIRDSDGYRDVRWLGISRSAVILALLNIVFAVIVMFVHVGARVP